MYAVIGVWEMDPQRREMQREGLEHVVAGVQQLPGFVKGYWAQGAEPTRSHTFVVFTDQASAESFLAEVRGNIDNQARAGVRNVSLDLAAVVAST
jgi:hypothetical protein